MKREERFEVYSGFYWFVQGVLKAKTTTAARMETIREEHMKIKRQLKASVVPRSEKTTPIQKARKSIEAIKKAGEKGIQLT